jgi:tetratricopeptide (TPR) repeat protein
MKIMTSLLLAAELLLSQNFEGLWEGPKQDGRFDNRIDNFGPIKISKNKNGSYSSTFLGSYSGDSDNKLHKTTISGNKITITFHSWGHPLLKAKIKDNILEGTLEHHGMTEKFTFYKFRDRSSKQIRDERKMKGLSFSPPSKSQFQRLILDEGISIAYELHQFLSENNLSEVLYTEQTLNSIGYNYLRKKNHRKAIACFEKNTLLFPNSANVYDSLGEAYFESGDYKLAEESLRKSLSMNPTKSTKENSLKILRKMGISVTSN